MLTIFTHAEFPLDYRESFDENGKHKFVDGPLNPRNEISKLQVRS